MSRTTNPIERKSLLATRNALYLKGSSSQVVNIVKSSAWDFGGGDFTISIIGQFDVDGLLLQSGAVGQADLSISLSGVSFRSSENVAYTITPSSSRYKLNRLNRITIIRRGTVIECWLNNVLSAQQTVGTNTFNLNASQPRIRIGDSSDAIGIAPFTGLAAQLVVIKAAMTPSQIESFHHTNIIPSALHANVVAHYPLNQNVGLKAYDVVEQYNYSKVSTITAIHGDLVNYTNDEAGVTNPLLQTAWQNLYEKKKVGLNFLKGNGTSIYSDIPSFTNQTFADGFAMLLDITIPTSASLEALFNNYSGAETEANMLFLFWNLTPGFLSFFTGNYTQGAVTVTAGKRYRILINSSVALNTIVNYMDAEHGEAHVWTRLGTSPNFFQTFTFLRDAQTSTRWYSGGINKAILYNKPLNQRERNALFRAGRSTEYKNISGLQFDIDFGDVFLDTGNYFARDSSGNNRHARIYNLTPATDQPLRIEVNTSLPERRKALRLVRTSSQYLSVAGFTPTKEKGYTYIMGITKPTNVDFQAVSGGSGEIMLMKYQADYSKYKLIRGASGSKVIETVNDGNGMGTSGLSYKDTTSIFFYASHELPNKQVGYNNGFVGSDNTTALLTGFDEITTDNFRIGSGDAPGNNQLDGYLIFCAVWKGVLTQAKILDIINNGLAGNAAPSLMADCQLYLNFEEIINDGGVFKIKDWSPQNRTVVLNNYTLAEITPGDPAYKLFDLDTLR